MPLYEVLIEAKQAVVLDLGAAYTKFGFTGEAAPRCIIPSEFYCSRAKRMKRVFDYETDEELYNNMVELLHVLYFKHVLVNPKDRKVVVVESLLTPTKIRETLASVLFSHYEVSSVVFAWWGACVAATECANIALCIDLGYNEARVEMYAHGSGLLAASRTEPLGAQLLHDKLSEAIDKDNERKLILDETVLEDIKVKACFVTTLSRSEKYKTDDPPVPPPAISYPLAGHDNITISGRTREITTECWFPRDRENSAISNMIMDAIMQAPIDLRKPLAENIIITGGSAMLPGIKLRLSQELKFLLTQEPYKDKLCITEFRFHTLPCMDNYSAWLGGGILGATDAINTRAVTNEQYKTDGRVKDWLNMLDNTSPENHHWEGLSL